jgi:hypothetical protein
MGNTNTTIGPYIQPQPEFPEGHPVLGIAGGAIGILIAKSVWESAAVACGDESNLLNLTQRYIIKPSKNYVPNGVFLVCSNGTNPAKLQISSQHTVRMAGGKLMGTINDRMDCNLNCTMMVVAGAIIGAIIAAIVVAIIAAAGVFTGGAAWVAIGIGAAAGLGGAAAGAGLGQLTSMIPCICDLLTRGAPWVPVHTFTKAEKQLALIETSQLPCFLGGVIQIVYSEATAIKLTDINSKEMWRDLGTVALGSILLGATGAGLGGLAYGGSVAFSAGGWSGLGAYSAAGLANIAGSFGAGFLIGEIKDRVIYNNIPIGDQGFSMGDYKTGEAVTETIKKNQQQEIYLDHSNSASEYMKTQEVITNIIGTDAGSVGGIYHGMVDGIWMTNDFVTTATNPSIGNYGNLMKGQIMAGFNSGFTPFYKKSDTQGRIFLGIDIFVDMYTIWRNYELVEDIEELFDTIENEEVKARKNLKVIENDI